jgi:acyl carrier protein
MTIDLTNGLTVSAVMLEYIKKARPESNIELEHLTTSESLPWKTLGFDSLDSVEMIMTVEDALDFSIRDESAFESSDLSLYQIANILNDDYVTTRST